MLKRLSLKKKMAPPPPLDKPELTNVPPAPPRDKNVATWPVKGSYVYARILDWENYYGGVVMKVVNANDFEILFDDGERHKHVLRKEIIKSLDHQSFVVPNSDLPPLANHRYKVGDRVSCRINGWSTYYDGVVTGINHDGYSVEFDDGERVSVVREKEMMTVKMDEDDEEEEGVKEVQPPPPPSAAPPPTKTLLPDFLKVNGRVEVKIDGWHKYYPGVVKAMVSDRSSCSVLFDDGEFKSLVKAEHVRLAKTKSTKNVKFAEEEEKSTTTRKFALNARVISNPFDEWTKAHPGKIEHYLDDGTYTILFDDGDRVAGVSECDIGLENKHAQEKHQGPLSEEDNEDETSYTAGQSIEAKVKAWRKYYPGVIRKLNANGTFVVDFLDGEVIHQVQLEEIRRPRQRAETATTSYPVDPNQVFHVGDRVAAKLTGWKKYWGGYVLQANQEDGLYKIEFDDGEIYSNVLAEWMTSPKPGSALFVPLLKPPPIEFFEVGERVECKVQNWKSYYPGLIEKRMGEDMYIVQFDDGERLVDVKVGEIRRLITVQNAKFSEGASSSDEE